jgi:hypothetical protein
MPLQVRELFEGLAEGEYVGNQEEGSIVPRQSCAFEDLIEIVALAIYCLDMGKEVNM